MASYDEVDPIVAQAELVAAEFEAGLMAQQEGRREMEVRFLYAAFLAECAEAGRTARRRPPWKRMRPSHWYEAAYDAAFFTLHLPAYRGQFADEHVACEDGERAYLDAAGIEIGSAR